MRKISVCIITKNESEKLKKVPETTDGVWL